MVDESLYETEQQDTWLNLEQMKIAKWLKKLRFRKKVFGGVNEQDVWKKISELNTMYEAALTAERVRYNSLIEHYKKECTKTTDNYEPLIENLDMVTGIEGETQYKKGSRNRGKVGNE